MADLLRMYEYVAFCFFSTFYPLLFMYKLFDSVFIYLSTYTMNVYAYYMKYENIIT